MKTILPFILLIISVLSLQAQDFQLLYEDAEGDQTQSVADLKAVWVAMDIPEDTVRFKVQFHTSIAGDVGLIFGIDTDGDHLTGEDWMGPNNSLNPEVMFTVNRNFIDPTFFYGYSNNELDYYALEGEDDMEIIVTASLSGLDLDTEGTFNFIVGTGGFDITTDNRQTYDNAPDETFLSVAPPSSVIVLAKNMVQIAPNPAQTTYAISDTNLAGSLVQIMDLNGRLIFSEKATENELVIACENWQRGIYTALISNEKQTTINKIVLQ